MEREFSWTPIEAQPAAIAVAGHLESEGHRVRVEPVVSYEREEAPYRPTLDATLGELVVLVEAQGSPDYTAELVEAEVRKLAIKAAKNGWLDRSEAAIDSMDTSNRIDVLASQRAYTGGRERLLDDNLKNDLHSFRGARNLFDHPTRGRREEQR